MNTIGRNNQAGNLTTDRRGYSYEYDYENRITKILKAGPVLMGSATDYERDSV